MRSGNVYKRLALKCRLKWLSHKAACPSVHLLTHDEVMMTGIDWLGCG